MRVISRGTLREFWSKHKDSEEPLKAWYAETKAAKWNNPNEIKLKYRSVSILKNGRAAFNIAGNKYRLVVSINYSLKIVYIRFIGTHREYDEINA